MHHAYAHRVDSSNARTQSQSTTECPAIKKLVLPRRAPTRLADAADNLVRTDVLLGSIECAHKYFRDAERSKHQYRCKTAIHGNEHAN